MRVTIYIYISIPYGIGIQDDAIRYYNIALSLFDPHVFLTRTAYIFL